MSCFFVVYVDIYAVFSIRVDKRICRDVIISVKSVFGTLKFNLNVVFRTGIDRKRWYKLFMDLDQITRRTFISIGADFSTRNINWPLLYTRSSVICDIGFCYNCTSIGVSPTGYKIGGLSCNGAPSFVINFGVRSR